MSAHRDVPTDHTGLRVLGMDESLGLLASIEVGRLAFHLDGEIVVLPVVHTVDGVDVCFQTAGDSKIGVAVNRERVSYEADSYDTASRSGWSVLVHGTAVRVTDDEEAGRLDDVGRSPWVPAPEGGFTWVRVRTQSVSGRELGGSD